MKKGVRRGSALRARLRVWGSAPGCCITTLFRALSRKVEPRHFRLGCGLEYQLFKSSSTSSEHSNITLPLFFIRAALCSAGGLECAECAASPIFSSLRRRRRRRYNNSNISRSLLRTDYWTFKSEPKVHFSRHLDSELLAMIKNLARRCNL